jgi:adenylate cyclase
MTISLRDLSACFEGVIPSIISTVSSDRIPNISYLSHVALIDDGHVALSNQFFSKTAANIRANPTAALILVDPRDGLQYRLIVSFDRSLDSGELFEEMAIQLRATSTQINMGHVMRLRSIDIYRVRSIDAIASPTTSVAGSASAASAPLAAAAAATRRISEENEIGAIIDAVLDGLRDGFGCDAAMLLLKDPANNRLVAVGSRGYPTTGIGSEVAIGEAVIGTAASERRPVRISDMSRIRRFGSAVQASSAEENLTRTIVLPGMADAMSQIALPMIAHGALRGVIFLESAERLAFTKESEAALSIVTAQAAAALALAENIGNDEPSIVTSVEASAPTEGRPFKVVHHAYDDSVFIDNEYLIKGVPGRLLVHLLGLHLREGRVEFTNREIRLSDELRLPDFKDNLETRLLLLRRRLEDKAAPFRLLRTGRGKLRLQLAGPALLETVKPKTSGR